MQRFLLSLLFLFPGIVHAAIVTRSGTINTDEVWASGDTHHVTGTVTISPGVSLTIEAGAVVKLVNTVQIVVDGTLSAPGTSGSPVIFTAEEDESVGDDVTPDATTPTPGQWREILVNGTGTANMSHVEVRWGGDIFGFDAAITVRDGGALSVDHCTVSDADSAGIRIIDSNPSISNCTIQNTGFYAMRMTVDSNPTITNPTFSNNPINGVRIDGGTTTMNTALDDPDVVYWMNGDYIVPIGQTLTVAAGQIIKAPNNVSLVVDGTLSAVGTAGSPIVFTSDRDDSAGGDTNNDGPTNGFGGDWREMQLNGSANLDHVEVRYGGDIFNLLGAVVVQAGATPTLSNCRILASDTSGIRIIDAAPTISDCTFEDSPTAAIRMSVDSNPAITAPTFVNNSINGVRIDGGTTTINTALDDPDVVYWINGTYVVPVGQTLTVAPGQVIKAPHNIGLVVDGTLSAIGTSANPIIFTSDHDDAAGGDTNNDGVSTMPAGGDWRDIVLGGSATLDHVEVRYGGNIFNLLGAVVVQAGATATLSNCRILASDTVGIRIIDASPVIADCSFEESRLSAIRMTVASDPDITAPQMTGNGTNAAAIDGGTLAGDATLDDPDVTYLLSGDYHVPAGLSLTIAPGQVIKAPNSVRLFIEGTLDAMGALLAPIIFTSDHDDSVGGDTDNNGLTQGSPGDWREIAVNGGVASLDHVHIRFGGDIFGLDAALHAANFAAVTVSNTIVDQIDTNGLGCADSAQLDATNLIVSRTGDHAINAQSGCMVSVINATFSDNQSGVFADAAVVDLVNANVTFQQTDVLIASNGADVNAVHSNFFNPDLGSPFEGLPDPIGSSGNISADPRYVSAPNGDFRLLGDSGSIDAGTSNGAPPTDILGNERFDNIMVANTGAGSQPFVDIGAFERQDGIPGALLPLADDGEAGDRAGGAVAVDGNRVAVGIPNADVGGTDTGQVLIFELEGDRFVLKATINVPVDFFAVNFGAALDLSGGQILIGAPGTSSAAAKSMPQAKGGSVAALQAALFERLSGGDWGLKTEVTPISGNTDDQFGASVALEGGNMVVGAPGDDDGGDMAGAVHVYEFDGNLFTGETKLMDENPTVGGEFGTAVDASDDMIAAGAPGGKLGNVTTGTATLFQQLSNSLDSLTATATMTGSGSAANDEFGHSVALAGEMMMVGAPMEDDGGNGDAGAAYVFDFDGQQLRRLSPETPTAGAHFGMAVALDGTDFLAGSPGADGGAGAVFRFDSAFRLVQRIAAAAGSQGFGMSVALQDNVLAAGAPDTDAQAGAAFAQLRNDLILFGSSFEQ